MQSASFFSSPSPLLSSYHLSSPWYATNIFSAWYNHSVHTHNIPSASANTVSVLYCILPHVRQKIHQWPWLQLSLTPPKKFCYSPKRKSNRTLHVQRPSFESFPLSKLSFIQESSSTFCRRKENSGCFHQEFRTWKMGKMLLEVMDWESSTGQTAGQKGKLQDTQSRGLSNFNGPFLLTSPLFTRWPDRRSGQGPPTDILIPRHVSSIHSALWPVLGPQPKKKI